MQIRTHEAIRKTPCNVEIEDALIWTCTLQSGFSGLTKTDLTKSECNNLVKQTQDLFTAFDYKNIGIIQENDVNDFESVPETILRRMDKSTRSQYNG